MSADAVGWRLVVFAIASAGILASGRDCQAQVPIPGYPNTAEALDPREVALLPRYCIYTQMFRDKVPGGNDPATIKGWYDKLGPTFHNLHHWCLGLMKTNRAILLSRTEQARQFYLNFSIVEFDYVIRTAPPDFVLLPEMLTRKAQNLILLDKGPVAVLELERAISLKNDYWPPYAYLSDYYKASGNEKKAREVLEDGLGHAPDAAGLQRRLADIDSAHVRHSTKR
jgi:hypothetical protein